MMGTSTSTGGRRPSASRTPKAAWSRALDAPITFARSLRATIEHGHANDRADDYCSVAYGYQTEPHAPFPAPPGVEERLPRAARR